MRTQHRIRGVLTLASLIAALAVLDVSGIAQQPQAGPDGAGIPESVPAVPAPVQRPVGPAAGPAVAARPAPDGVEVGLPAWIYGMVFGSFFAGMLVFVSVGRRDAASAGVPTLEGSPA